ncbi:MAG: site-specific integrase [Deltaproteobacteria bacterium]|nr:site-specific integrase [Deltaproteobacteria bacterium]
MKGLPNTAPPEVLRSVLDPVEQREPEVRAFVTLLVHTGLRPNEVLALKWTDLDDVQHVVHVVRGISADEVVDRPKTRNGIRTVALTDEMAVALDDHRKALLRRQPEALREGWIFPVTRGRGPRRLAWGYFALREVVKAAGVTKRLTASGLRRAWIDAARRVALDPVLVRRVVGHADDSMRDASISRTFREPCLSLSPCQAVFRRSSSAQPCHAAVLHEFRKQPLHHSRAGRTLEPRQTGAVLHERHVRIRRNAVQSRQWHASRTSTASGWCDASPDGATTESLATPPTRVGRSSAACHRGHGSARRTRPGGIDAGRSCTRPRRASGSRYRPPVAVHRLLERVSHRR